MSDLILLSRVHKTDSGESYVNLNPECLKQMGWDDNTYLEWEQINDMIVIREMDNGNCN
jgi:hypothetical protein